jgi:molecular chaperone GrpE
VLDKDESGIHSSRDDVVNEPMESADKEGDQGGGETGKGKSSRGKAEGRGGSRRKLTKKEILAILTEKNQSIQDLTERVETVEAEAKDLKDKWLRSVAEFENYRKRTLKEWELLQQRTKAEVIQDILNVLDDFERAFSAAGDREDDFTSGIRLIYNNLQASLEKLGVTRIEALDSPFDPAYHMAVAQLERQDADPNHVIEVVQEGYLLGDVVIRPAKVVIAS